MRAFLIRRNSISLAICGIAAVLMFYVVNYPAAVDASASARQLPIYCVQRDQKLVSISFDAAWGNEDTQELIDILDRFQVKATFFVVGDWVDKYPESVKALHDAGHEVMNHSNTHAHYPQLSPQAVVDDLNACNDKIEAVTINPAEVLGIDDRKGSLTAGKDADIVVWDQHPFAYQAHVEQVFLSGKAMC